MARKSIKDLLKAASTTSDKFSLSEELNKLCAEGTTYDSGVFSLRSVKKMLQDLADKCDSFEREDFFLQFFKLYHLMMAPDIRAKGVFHPSQLLDGCTRCMAYELSGVSPDERTRDISGELQRTFDVGSWYHLYFQNLLYKMGALKQAEVPVINKEKFINGKADGLFHDHVFGESTVLEIKSMNNFNFNKAIFGPFKKHEFQASLYARELGATKVLYLYINKDTSAIKDFLVDTNKEQLTIADKKMDTVLGHVKGGTLPPIMCKDRFCSRALDCPYSKICLK